eukprot:2632219-Pyramimonas_sp.AAC.1
MSAVGGRFKVGEAVLTEYYDISDASVHDAWVSAPEPLEHGDLHMLFPDDDAGPAEHVCLQYGDIS